VLRVRSLQNCYFCYGVEWRGGKSSRLLGLGIVLCWERETTERGSACHYQMTYPISSYGKFTGVNSNSPFLRDDGLRIKDERAKSFTLHLYTWGTRVFLHRGGVWSV
jgi:hypothetical protein